MSDCEYCQVSPTEVCLGHAREMRAELTSRRREVLELEARVLELERDLRDAEDCPCQFLDEGAT